MNRIRHAYLELVPALEPYFITSHYDDEKGMLQSSFAMPRRPSLLQPFLSIPGVVAVVDSAVAGAIVGIAALGLGLGTGGSLALGGIGFVSSLTGFILWARRSIATHVEQLVVRFPSPS